MILLAPIIIATPWLLRGLLLFEKGQGLSQSDLQGFSSDLGVGILVAALALGSIKFHRIIPSFVAIAWIILNFANYEHIRAFDTAADFTYAHYLTDPVFFWGSATSVSHPLLLVGLMAGAIAAGRWAQRPSTARLGLVTGLGVLAIGASLIGPHDDGQAGWRQEHVAVTKAKALTGDDPSFVHSYPPRSESDLGLEADLSGEPILSMGNPGDNVLLVVLEGVSGAYLPSIAAQHGVKSSIEMPQLDALSSEAITYTSFLAHQRQTNRGEYSLLCGDLPKLDSGVAKMTEFATSGKKPTCLPRVLSDAGYRTSYLQAAPLGFMSKNQFMPRAGFEESDGTSWLDYNYSRNRWGVDDGAFLEQSVERVRELQSGGSPWFLTLLTVGTHHPYIVPEAFQATGSDRARAFQYLDEAVGRFVATLKEEGLLEDTLLLITSDESAGLEKRGSDFVRSLSQNWSFMTAVPPTDDPVATQLNRPYVHSDVAISVLDYLGFEEDGDDFIGRSMFRRYPDSRPLYMANTYAKRVYYLEGDWLTACSSKLRDCRRYGVNAEQLFSSAQAGHAPTEDRVKNLAGALAHSTGAPDAGTSSNDKRVYSLTSQEVVPVANGEGTDQLIFGGQYVSVSGDTRMRVALDVELRGEGGITFKNDVYAQGTTYYRPVLPPLRAGDRLRLRYDYSFEKPRNKIENRLFIHRRSEGELELVFHEARMSLQSGGEEDGAGVDVEVMDVERGEGAAGWKYELGDFQTGECARSDKGVVRVADCENGQHFIFGPYAPAGRDAKVVVRFDIEVMHGQVRVFGDLVSDSGQRTHGRFGGERLAAGQKATLELETTLSETVDDLEARLRAEQLQKPASLAIADAELVIEDQYGADRVQMGEDDELYGKALVQSHGGPERDSWVKYYDRESEEYRRIINPKRGLTLVGFDSRARPVKLGHKDTCNPADPPRDFMGFDGSLARLIDKLNGAYGAYAIVAHDSAHCGHSQLGPLFRGLGLEKGGDLGFREPYIGIIGGNGNSKEFTGPEESKLNLMLTDFIQEPGDPREVWGSLPYVAHAGGALDGQTYTNSIDALNANKDRYRLFEIDFSITSDDRAVCLHDWGHGFERSFGFSTEAPVSRSRFLRLVDQKAKFQKCTLESLVEWMQDNEQARIVTDGKGANRQLLRLIADSYPELQRRFIPQVYNPDDYKLADELGFQDIIWTLYRYDGQPGDVLAELQEMELFALTMPSNKADQGLALEVWKRHGVNSYVHTINRLDKAERYYALGVSGIYTDRLFESGSETNR